MNLDTITLADLATATVVTHWGYRQRDLVSPLCDVADYDYDVLANQVGALVERHETITHPIQHASPEIA